MLYLMRNKIKSVVMWFIIGAFLATIFYAWGVGSARRGSGKRGEKNWVAHVAGEKISAVEYERALQRMQDRFQDLPAELVKKLNLKERTLEGLIRQRLLQQEAQRMGIEIPNEELARSIETLPYFQENGTFSKRAYRTALSQYFKMTPTIFENRQRAALQVQKLEDLIGDTVKVSEKEIHQAYVRQNEKVVIEYALLRADDHRPKGRIRKAAAQAYYEKHQEDFRTKEEINVLYAYLTPQDFFREVTLPEGAAKRYYKENKEDYVQPEKIRVRHILIRVPRNADGEALQKAREKIEGILKQVKAGQDFTELARKYSQDSSASRGGDLGYFAKGQMVKAFEKAAFALQPGETSGIVQSKFGFHIIKMEDHKAAIAKSFEEVRPRIEAKLKFIEALHHARKKAMHLYAEIRKGKDFRGAIEEAGYSLRETGYFSRADNRIAGIPTDLARAFNEEAFAAGDNGVGRVRGDQGFLLLQVLKRRPPRIPALKEVRAKVNAAVAVEMGRENVRKAAVEMVKALKGKHPFVEAAKQAKAVETKTTAPFTRTESPVSPDFTKAAFALTADHPADRIETKQGEYVLFLRKKIPADESAYAGAKEEIKKSLREEKKKNLLAAWVNQIRKGTTVKVNQDLLDRI
ncbi:MAG: hypothetical protein GXP58_00335 [Deltaproteobacteria bacterium]|nr:hypothetical protein [Deltaproteobacteria bacterium]